MTAPLKCRDCGGQFARRPSGKGRQKTLCPSCAPKARAERNRKHWGKVKHRYGREYREQLKGK